MRVCLRLLIVFGLLIIGIGCAGTKEAADKETEPSVELADVETFDPGPYQVEARERAPFELVHRVPDELMEPADSSRGKYSKTLLVRSGFRIQIFSGESKSNADERLQQALNWWQEEGTDLPSAESIFSDDLPIRVVYSAPYYKVRIGDFLTRPEAQKALEIVRHQFPDAWIVPDQVEIYR